MNKLFVFCEISTEKKETKSLDEIKIVTYCIIRCKVTNYDERIFRPNRNNYYTGNGLQTVQEECYTIDLILNDGDPIICII